ncbi:MAG: hypothetical protein K0U72_04640 [Gammaproteobacteria bacterium]|nr:hypothetical protein [Gammaproteobacteria bacterium]
MFKAKQILWAGLLFSVIQLSAIAEEYTDGPAAMFGISWTAEQHFSRSQFDELDEMFVKLSESQTRFDDGRWPIAGFTGGIVDFFIAHKDWEWMKGNIAAWREHNNLSAAAAIVEAQFWITYAWNARGEGYANTVAPEGWKLFQERLEKAREVLDESKNYASHSPLWYDKYLAIAVAQGWSRGEVQSLFDEAIAKEPYFYGHYFSLTRYLQPRWHGSYSEIEEFAKQAARVTRDIEGTSLYARIYWYLNQLEPVDFKLFEDSQASWPSMRKGFDDLMARYPKSYWNMNNFAAFACRAGDPDVYWPLRAEFEGREFHMAWPSNLAIEICDERMKDGAADF